MRGGEEAGTRAEASALRVLGADAQAGQGAGAAQTRSLPRAGLKGSRNENMGSDYCTANSVGLLETNAFRVRGSRFLLHIPCSDTSRL